MITAQDLSSMSLEDMQRAALELERAIRARGGEARFGVWVVEGWPAPTRYFKESDFIPAAEALLEAARDLEAAGVKLSRRDLRLSHRLLPASEYRQAVGEA